MRPVAISLARALNAAFFLATSAYCLLAYSPFAYQQFLKPEVISWVPAFLAIHTALFWLALLVTALTLTERLKPDAMNTVRLKPDPPHDAVEDSHDSYVVSGFSRTAMPSILSRAVARAYLIGGAVLGAVLLFRPLMPSIGNTRRSLVIALLALVPPMWLALVDHLSQPAPRIEPSGQRRLLETCAAAAGSVWAAYAVGAPFRLARISGVELPPASLVFGAGLSAVAHAFVFMAIFLALAAIVALARTTKHPAAVEYWLIAIAAAATIAAIVYGLVFTSIAFVGQDAVVAAVAVGAAIAMVWSGMAWQRGTDVAVGRALPTALELWLAPLTSNGSRAVAGAVLGLLPVAAYVLVSATGGLDWNFVIQKLGVAAVWLLAFAAVHTTLRRVPSKPAGYLSAVPPCLALVLFQAVAPFATRLSLADRYAAVDMSFRLIRDLRVAHSGETANFYAVLKAHTLVSPLRVTAPDIQLAGDLQAAKRPPHIFLFLIDSLRRDYVSPYNPAVTFTPAIARFASDSYVFERAWTRYAGTGLAVPSIWAGSMLMHMLDERPFDSRNALLTLLDADGYRRVMSIDHIMRDLLPPAGADVELDRGVAPMESDFCRTLRELETRLAASLGDPRPVFSYTLPQNVHIAVASKRVVPEGHAYPGFFAPVAESVRQVDACFGEFLAFLRRSTLYDDSIVILTSDHGDSLGEEGRWGHAYFMVPEVMRIPLIVHVPPPLRDRLHADLHRVSFSTDITPTLYALLGHQPKDLGPLFGAPLLVGQDRELVPRRRESFLLASSYGAVYGMLRHNGRILYTADAIDGRDDAYDVHGMTGQRITATGAMTALNRRLMIEQLGQLAALNHYVPAP